MTSFQNTFHSAIGQSYSKRLSSSGYGSQLGRIITGALLLTLSLFLMPEFSFGQIDSLPPTDTIAVTQDSINPDTTFSKLLKKFGVKDTTLHSAVVDSTGGLIVSGDSTIVDSSGKKKKRKRLKRGTPEWEAWASTLDPDVAWKRSAMLPGLGQAYNRAYWKIPIVYAGFGALGYFFVDNHKSYKEFQAGYQCRLDTSCTDTFTGIQNSTMVSARDYYRRNRDFTVILGVLWYGINLVDAYVEAHLKYFDVSDDLSLQMKPSLMMVTDTRRRLIPAAGLTLKIK